MIHFYAYLSRMKHIKRWGLMRNTEMENIKEHSFDVAVIAHALALIKNKLFGGETDPLHVMALALFHEAGEVITGDIATPIKYFNPEVNEAFKNIEHIAAKKIVNMAPVELREDYAALILHEGDESYKIVKEADKLCAYIKCLEEGKTGNTEFAKARVKIEGDLRAMDAPEVAYFMEHCIQAYELTLDELNS